MLSPQLLQKAKSIPNVFLNRGLALGSHGCKCHGNLLLLAKSIKLPPAKPEVYCLSASKARVTQEPPEGGYSPNFIWS